MAEEEVKTYNTAEKGFATRCSMHTHGTFSTPSYGGVGEPYRKDKEHDPRAQGLQFTTNKQRAGQTGANWNNNNGRRNDHKILFEVCAHLRTLPTPFHVADCSAAWACSTAARHCSSISGSRAACSPCTALREASLS